jgi:4-amino-4-deoxy-L-arabinose transferase-like glycosyltransferase
MIGAVRRSAMLKRAPVLVTLLVAAALRLTGLNWDGGIAAHPDERYIVGVAESLRWPDMMNPLAVAPDFAYGHLSLYLLALTGGLRGAGNMLMVGRVLGALFEVLTVALTFELGRNVYGVQWGLLGATLMALTLLHIQQAHFYTADTLLASFAPGAILFSARLARSGRLDNALLAGVWAGLAVGTKSSAALLIFPVGVACALLPDGRSRLRRGLQSGAALLATFALTNPFVIRNPSIFLHNVMEQAAIASGALDVPYTRQYHATWPYLYPAAQLLWGMGLPLTLAAVGGLFCTLWEAVRKPLAQAEWVVLSWVVPGLAFFGALYARFPRYLLPFVPVLVLYAARAGKMVSALPPLRVTELIPWGVFYSLPLAFFCLCYCLAFVNIYRSPHPWIAASEWFYKHVPAGATIAVEEWDHPLPLRAEGYRMLVLPVFEEEGPEKWKVIEQILAQTDYIVIASQRGYGSLARWPARYPMMGRYYRLLFTGALGFEPVACFWRYPGLGPLTLASDPTAGLGFSLPQQCWPDSSLVLRTGRLDESFSVYDHPQTIIFRRGNYLRAD